MSYRVTLAGQDITASVEEPTLQVVSNLGQGAGVMSHTSGRATTVQFVASMGPLSLAKGAGEFTAPPLHNILTRNESDIETDTTGFVAAGGATLSQDKTTAYQGLASLKVVYLASHSYPGASIHLDPTKLGTGVLVTFSAWVNAPAGTTMQIGAQHSVSPYTGYGQTNFTATGGWQRVSATFTTPTTTPADQYELFLVYNGTPTTGATFWVDALQLEQNSVATDWVEGGTPGVGNQLVRQGELLVYDASGNTVFGGYLTNLDDRTNKPPQVRTLCKGVDYWSHLDRITVTKTYDGVSDTAAIKDLLTTYAPWIDLSHANLSVSNITLYKQVYRGKSLQQALQHIADITGFDLWVDATKALYYAAPTQDGNAPFAISDHPDHLSTYPAKFGAHSLDDNATINRVTFVGGSHPTDDFTQDISTQANGANTTFVLAYTPHESSDGKIHVLVGGVEQVVGYALTTDKLKSAGGTCDVLVDRSKGTLLFNVAPATGATVTCKYRYQTPLVVVVTNQQSYSKFGQWFDGLISDQTVFDTTTALQRCRTLLAEQAMGLEKLSFSCWQPGLQAGMRVLVINSLRGLNTTFRIQSVTTVFLGGGVVRYDVQAGAWDWKLADILMAAARYSQQADQNFDELNVTLQALELVEHMKVTDTWTIHTRQSGQYYARATAVGDGHDAYPGLSTITS